MTRRQFALILVFGIAGYAVCVLLFSRVHPAARTGQAVDRTRAIEIASVEAQRIGFDVTDTLVRVETSFQRDSGYFLRTNPNTKFAAYLSPTTTVVTFLRKTSKSLEVTIANDGRIVGWQQEEPKPAQTVTLPPEEGRRKATEAVATLLGVRFPAFKQGETADSSLTRYTWTLEDPQEPRVKIEALGKIDNGNASGASLTAIFSNDYLESIRNERRIISALRITWPILMLLGLLLCMVIYVRNIVRKDVSHFSTLLLALVSFLLITIWMLAGDFFDDIYSGLYSAPRLQGALGVSLALALVSLLSLVFVVPVLLTWGAGYPFASKQPVNPLRGLEIVLRGHLQARLTGKNIFIGLAFGWVLPVLSLTASAAVGTRGMLRSPDQLAAFLTSRFPLIAPPTESAIVCFYIFIIVYVFLLPLASAYLHRRTLIRLGAILLGALSLIGVIGFHSSVSVAMIAAVALFLVLDQLTFRVDVVAGLVAIVSGDCAVRLATLVTQPSSSLHNSGMSGWALFGLFAIVIGYIGLRGRELGEGERHPVWSTAEQVGESLDRDRLKAEFDVARRAQQQMLPDVSPDVPGFEIASVCRPAREVGGDLYDFIQFEGDRVGIVVADVSGKGVPASLYMTLTKGLLTSIAEATNDPGEILKEVNRHLYVACGKKMFVTLLLGIVDPRSRTFSYARAGHNPPVWWRASSKETVFLRARGLGLGLNSGDVFNRALVVETIQLEPGDKLVLYSDGITEAMNRDREEYGEERLIALTARSAFLGAEQLRDAILTDVSGFLGNVSPQDDQTLVVVQVGGSNDA